MASITITIPDDKVDKVTSALCGIAGLEDTVANAKIVMVRLLKGQVLMYENLQRIADSESDPFITIE